MAESNTRSDQKDAERNYRWAYALLVEVAKLLWLRQPQSKKLPWEQLDAGNKIALFVQAREDAGIPEEEWLKIERSGIYVVSDLFEGERLVSDRERHEQLMASVPDYRERWLRTTLEPGKTVTAVMTVVDRYDSGQLMESMYGQEPKLVGGCKVSSLFFCNLAKKHEDLRRGVSNALLTDNSTTSA